MNAHFACDTISKHNFLEKPVKTRKTNQLPSNYDRISKNQPIYNPSMRSQWRAFGR